MILITLVLLSYFRLDIISILLVRKQNNAQKRLLSETNYKLLLETCRKLPKPIQNHGRVYYSDETISSNLPEGFSGEVILSLKPKMVYIDEDGRISIALGNTFWNFGVRAYPEDFKEPYSGFIYGNQELIPGLWYYDELYERNPNYDKIIDKMIKKNKRSN